MSRQARGVGATWVSASFSVTWTREDVFTHPLSVEERVGALEHLLLAHGLLCAPKGAVLCRREGSCSGVIASP